MPEENQNRVEVNSEDSDKFGGDYEKLMASYKALESKLGKPSGENDNETVPTEESPAPTTEGNQETDKGVQTEFTETVTNALSAAEIDAASLQKEFESEGGLSEESVTKLNSIFGEDLVKYYLKGIEAESQQQTASATETNNKLLEIAGGEDNWNTIQSWAITNDPQLVESFNSAIDRNDYNTIQGLALALRTSYESRVGTLSTSSVKAGSVPSSGSTAGFSDNNEMIEAMKDPRYAKSQAYRDEVAAKLRASTFG